MSPINPEVPECRYYRPFHNHSDSTKLEIMQKKSFIARASITAGVAALLATSLVGCSIGRTDVAAMVYKVTVDSPSAIANTDITFAHTKDPEESIDPVMVSADPSTFEGEEWSDVGSIVGKETATLSATPPAGVTATCAILRDGSEELVSKVGEPGETVTCEVVTPKRTPGILKGFGNNE